ncbi:MAG: efflux RND transporter periplasmic adaptor subunit [Acidobacteria bacterium]|nr:efflux RND transporter periplasmic adaptor subunit [Acidobacteriota bacterium]
MRVRSRPWILALAASLAALAAGACRRGAEPAAAAGPVGVSVQAARLETLRDAFTASGTVVPSPAGELTIVAPEAAQIAELPKHEGEAVATGDLLVRFEIPSLAQELAARELAVADAAARVERAKAEVARLSTLVDRGIAARATLEAARIEQTAADAVHAQAVTQLRAATIETDRATVRARFPGTVTRVFRAVGEFVRAEIDPVLQVIDPARYQVAVDLPIAQMARVIPGQTAVVRPIAGAADIAATVAQKSTITDPTAPTGQVRLALSDTTGLQLDAPVSAEILLDQRTNALAIPTSALLRDDLSPFVMIAGDDRRAHRRDVRPGLSTSTLTEIVAGLEVGDRVIVGGAAELAEGTAVSFVD